MTPRPISLIDQSTERVASLEVGPVGDHFEGAISLDTTPPELKQLFEEYEEIVEGQILSLLDEIEEKISSIPIRAVFDNGSMADVRDLQVFPTTRSVSFKTIQQLPI